MKSFAIYAKYDAKLIDVPEPQLENARSVKVKVKACGICGTDIHIFRGEHKMSQGNIRIPGHEFVGEVIDVGAEVSNLKVGDRVVHEPISFCGRCYACRNNQPNVCESIRVTGCNCSGGMAEYFVADCSQWHILPDAVTWEEAALIEPYTIGAQICARAEVKFGDVVLIYGGGPIGLIAGNTAKNLGATVILSEILDKRLSLAREIGMDYVIDVKTENVRQRVQEITCFKGPNVVFDCAGLPSMISEAIELLSPAGRLVPVAGGTFAVDGYQMLIKQLAIVGSRLQNKQFKRVVDKFVDYKAIVARMITDRFPFHDADKAFEYANEHRPETGKIVLLFD